MIYFALLTCLLLPKARKTKKKNGSRGATYVSCLYQWRHLSVTTKTKMASPECVSNAFAEGMLKVPFVFFFVFVFKWNVY